MRSAMARMNNTRENRRVLIVPPQGSFNFLSAYESDHVEAGLRRAWMGQRPVPPHDRGFVLTIRLYLGY